MVKTTVYLQESEAAALRRMAARSGRSQAEIIREAVAAATADARKHRFKSHDVAHGTGQAVGQDAEHILRQEIGRRR